MHFLRCRTRRLLRLSHGLRAHGRFALAKSAAENVEKLTQEIDKLEKAIDSGDSAAELAGMKDVRSVVDALERIVPDSQWPVPGYGEMFFVG